MKCPKCGFNSFEYYDDCKKCSNDLRGYKQTHSITPLILPLEVKDRLVAEFSDTDSVIDQSADVPEAHSDIFSFDLPDEDSQPSAQLNDDPFDFKDQADVADQPIHSQSEDDIFAGLLDSTSQASGSPFGEVQGSETTPASTVESTLTATGPGEFDLGSFSWDETPADTVADDTKGATDDFDSLFGDTKEINSK